MHANIVPDPIRDTQTSNSVRKQGLLNKAVAQGVGISKCHASTIWQRYKKEGNSAIKIGQRGRQHGEQRSFRSEAGKRDSAFHD